MSAVNQWIQAVASVTRVFLAGCPVDRTRYVALCAAADAHNGGKGFPPGKVIQMHSEPVNPRYALWRSTLPADDPAPLYAYMSWINRHKVDFMALTDDPTDQGRFSAYLATVTGLYSVAPFTRSGGIVGQEFAIARGEPKNLNDLWSRYGDAILVQMDAYGATDTSAKTINAAIVGPGCGTLAVVAHMARKAGILTPSLLSPARPKKRATRRTLFD